MKRARILSGLAAVFAVFSLAPSAFADRAACEKACHEDWPREYYHAVPRRSCLAKCWALDTGRAAWDTTKEVAGRVADTAKEVGGRVADTVKDVGGRVIEGAKNLAKGAWDAARNCVADGLGGCINKVLTAAGNLARGLWDAAKKCVADGLGGCIKKIAKAAADGVCKNVIGAVWNEAKQCCLEKGALQCAKEATIHVLREGAKWLCGKVAPKITPKLHQAAAWALNKVGDVLKGYSISLKGSEIGALACAFKQPVGHDITDLSAKFGDPTLTINNITLSSHGGSGGVSAFLGASASVSVPGKPALTLRLEGIADAIVDSSCNFEGPLVTFGARVTKVGISSIPQWLTNTAVKEFVNPNLGCMTFCPPALTPDKTMGVDVKINYCKVIDTCLKSNCTAPVVNTLINQIFPIAMPLAPMLPANPKLAPVRAEIQGWNIAIGGVKFRTNTRNPYAPSISATVSIGPAGRPKFNVHATGTLRIKTTCRDDGQSMVKVTPSLSIKLGDVPGWMQEISLPNIANRFIEQAAAEKGGPAGRFAIAYPGFLSGKPGKKELKESDGPGLVETIKKNWEGIKAAVRTALAGRFKGDRAACDAVPREPKAKKRGGGSCVLCMQEDRRATPKKPRKPARAEAAAPAATEDTSESLAAIGHTTGDGIRFRSSPSMRASSHGVLSHCQEFKILERDVPGAIVWTKIERNGKVGYVAQQFVARGPAFCGKKTR